MEHVNNVDVKNDHRESCIPTDVFNWPSGCKSCKGGFALLQSLSTLQLSPVLLE